MSEPIRPALPHGKLPVALQNKPKPSLLDKIGESVTAATKWIWAQYDSMKSLDTYQIMAGVTLVLGSTIALGVGLFATTAAVPFIITIIVIFTLALSILFAYISHATPPSNAKKTTTVTPKATFPEAAKSASQPQKKSSGTPALTQQQKELYQIELAQQKETDQLIAEINQAEWERAQRDIAEEPYPPLRPQKKCLNKSVVNHLPDQTKAPEKLMPIQSGSDSPHAFLDWTDFKKLVAEQKVDGKAVNLTPLLHKAYEAVNTNSIASFSLYLQSLHGVGTKKSLTYKLENDQPILAIYEAFLRTITQTPFDEKVCLNQLHVRAWQLMPVSTEQAVQTLESAINSGCHHAGFYKIALDEFKRQKLTFDIKIECLESFEDHILSENNEPLYFSKKFEFHKTHFERDSSKSKEFDYINFLPNAGDFVTDDFSNCYFGGGAFAAGGTQEEWMVVELLPLAMVALLFPHPCRPNHCALSPREVIGDNTRTREFPYQGYPSPLLFRNVSQVVKYSGGQALPVPAKQGLNIVAAASAKAVKGTSHHLKVILDMYNTAYTEGLLLKKAGLNVFASGPRGGGFFGNSRLAVDLVNRFVCEDLDLNLKHYGYTESTQNFDQVYEMFRAYFMANPDLTHRQCMEKIQVFIEFLEKDADYQKEDPNTKLNHFVTDKHVAELTKQLGT